MSIVTRDCRHTQPQNRQKKEKHSLAKPELTYQKLRGGYYTPKPIADFLARWAIRTPNAVVLEPSCGDGMMLESAIHALQDMGSGNIEHQVQGIEFDLNESQKSIERLSSLGIPTPSLMIHKGDFFAYCIAHLSEKRHFDSIIGNPPFIRYQNFPEEQRLPAFELMRRIGLKPTRLTNTWVPFIVASSLLLKPNGRLAMVVPAELLQVNYAAELRLFLSNYFQKITLVTFRQLVFEGIQQEVVLLLAELNDGLSKGISTIELDNANDLTQLIDIHDIETSAVKPLDHSKEKWTQYFLDAGEIELLREVRKNASLKVSGDIIDVDVGIVTGQNSFFVLNNEQIMENGLKKYSRKIVSRSGHLKGVVFSNEDWKTNDSENLATHLLDFSGVGLENIPADVLAYVNSGELANVNAGYKCSIRNPWYVVPSPWIPDAFMLRQIHTYPKIIVNSANATCTDTIHRVRLRNGLKKESVAAMFLNSVTFAFSEVTGRSYGGGVLELEPREAENLPVPYKGASDLDLNEIHELVLKNRIYDVLEITDRVLLHEQLGMSMKDVRSFRAIWEKLRDRRVNRKRAKTSTSPKIQTRLEGNSNPTVVRAEC